MSVVIREGVTMMDETLGRSDDTIATAAKGGILGSEHLMGHYGSRAEAETVVRRLQEVGVSPTGISLSEPVGREKRQARPHIAEGLLSGMTVGGLLGALFGAIFAVPSSTVFLFGHTFAAEQAGAVSGLGYGLVLGIVLGMIVGVLAKGTATSPISDFDELNVNSTVIDVQVPATLVPKVREILNAS